MFYKQLTNFNLQPAAPKTEEPYRFTANPIPKAILEKPVGIKPKPELPVTVPQSPAITKPKRVKVASFDVSRDTADTGGVISCSGQQGTHTHTHTHRDKFPSPVAGVR